jgi:hypothetical protein
VTEETIYCRRETSSQTIEDAKKQIASQEIWGGPCRGLFASDIPKVKAYIEKSSLAVLGWRGIEFKTEVQRDPGTRPGLAYWSGDREGVRNEDGYAKINVEITFCNQLDEV